LRDSAAQFLELLPDAPEGSGSLVRSIENAEQVIDFLAPNLSIDLAQKQAILEELDVEKRLRAVQIHITTQLEIAQIQQKLQKDVASHFSDAQRKAYLRQQLKAIQQELGEGETGADQQIAQLRTRLEQAKPPADILAQAERELKRLDFIPPASPEYSVIVTYVETIAELPWSKVTEDNIDLDQAQQILDRDHFDLEKVKRRLVEYLAVRKLNPQGTDRSSVLLGRRRGQDEFGAIDCRRARSQVCAHESWRHPRRSGNPRASPHLHRFDSGSHYSGAAPRRHAQSGHDA
jgi:ATP-dependent Lon protease